MNIPKRIIQSWVDHMPPYEISQCLKSVELKNPGWDYSLSTNEDFEAIILASSILDNSHLDAYPTGIQRADIFRIASLYNGGGVYIDADMYCYRHVEDLLQAAVGFELADENTEVILTTDHPVHSLQHNGGREVMMNNFIIAKPHSKFTRLFLEKIRENSLIKYDGLNDPVITTGPLLITDLIDEAGGPEALNIAVIPYFWVQPLPDMNLRFESRGYFEEIILDRSWRSRFCPFLAHFWHHSYNCEHNMLKQYGKFLLPPSD